MFRNLASKIAGSFNYVFKRDLPKPKYVGKDHWGNIYYEKLTPYNDKRPVSRFYAREDIDPMKPVVEYTEVPPAWDAWLRFRRQEPPTEEEVAAGDEYFKVQQEMAAKRKAEEDARRSGETKSTEVYASKAKRLNHDRGPPPNVKIPTSSHNHK